MMVPRALPPPPMMGGPPHLPPGTFLLPILLTAWYHLVFISVGVVWCNAWWAYVVSLQVCVCLLPTWWCEDRHLLVWCPWDRHPCQASCLGPHPQVVMYHPLTSCHPPSITPLKTPRVLVALPGPGLSTDWTIHIGQRCCYHSHWTLFHFNCNCIHYKLLWIYKSLAVTPAIVLLCLFYLYSNYRCEILALNSFTGNDLWICCLFDVYHARGIASFRVKC